MHSTLVFSNVAWQDAETIHIFFCGVAFSASWVRTKHLSFYYELVYVNIFESVLTIFPDRKFKISWQPNDAISQTKVNRDFTHSVELMK